MQVELCLFARSGWPQQLDSIVRSACYFLAVRNVLHDSAVVTARLHELLLYEPGACSTSAPYSQSTDQAGTTFATLNIMLPGSHEVMPGGACRRPACTVACAVPDQCTSAGGRPARELPWEKAGPEVAWSGSSGHCVDRHVCRSTEKFAIEVTPSSDIDRAGMWLMAPSAPCRAGCKHTVMPVTEGYRICLSYRLLVPPIVPPACVPQPTLQEDLLAQLSEAIAEWETDPDGPCRLIFLLDDRHAVISLYTTPVSVMVSWGTVSGTVWDAR